MRGFTLPSVFPDHLLKYKNVIFNKVQTHKNTYLDEFINNQSLYEVSWNLLMHKRFNAVERHNKHFCKDVEICLGGEMLDERIDTINLYNLYKNTIVNEVDSILSQQDMSQYIIVPYHKYSRDEFLIPLASWENEYVQSVESIDNRIVRQKKYRLKYKKGI